METHCGECMGSAERACRTCTTSRETSITVHKHLDEHTCLCPVSVSFSALPLPLLARAEAPLAASSRMDAIRRLEWLNLILSSLTFMEHKSAGSAGSTHGSIVVSGGGYDGRRQSLGGQSASTWAGQGRETAIGPDERD